uniref:Uncharacterized protein n=1 Tax=Rhizophora mucronata TaxID=61149 RepID=A0A2P2IHZ3_RHIMU
MITKSCIVKLNTTCPS